MCIRDRDIIVPPPEPSDENEDEEFYDLETLKKVTQNFYFD